MTFYRRPTKLTKIMNGGMGWLASLGRTPSDTVTLEVKGRRTGAVRSTVVTSVEHEGVRYLVSPRGESEWVRNVRAAGGGGAIPSGGGGGSRDGGRFGTLDQPVQTLAEGEPAAQAAELLLAAGLHVRHSSPPARPGSPPYPPPAGGGRPPRRPG